MFQLRIVYKPLGVVGLITPWNGPFVLLMNQAAQAMLAGNTIVAKGSEVTPFSAHLAEDIFRQAGLPDGVLQVLLGDGETGAGTSASSAAKSFSKTNVDVYSGLITPPARSLPGHR